MTPKVLKQLPDDLVGFERFRVEEITDGHQSSGLGPPPEIFRVDPVNPGDVPAVYVCREGLGPEEQGSFFSVWSDDPAIKRVEVEITEASRPENLIARVAIYALDQQDASLKGIR